MSRAPLIDIGINLAHDAYDVDRAAVIGRAIGAGLVHLIVTGSSLDSSGRAAALAAHSPDLLSFTSGVHPHHAAEFSAASLGELRALARRAQPVAIGECGLDYFRDLAPRSAQRRAFAAQIELAIELKLPLFLHCRDAHSDFVAVLKSYGPARPNAVAHCFTGTLSEAEELLSLGLHLGITGWICDERRGQHLQEVVRVIPEGRFMLETDGPYLLPRDLSPKPAHRRNEPSYLAHICRRVAEARGEPWESLARATSATARALFHLPVPRQN